MMDWDKLRVFHSVANAGSFTEAGVKLGCSQSAVSRQIRALEDALKVTLFTRHARGLVLTQEGKQLFNTTRDIGLQIEETARNLIDMRSGASGLLRVSTMVTFGAVWLTPHLKEFMITYPDLDLELTLADLDLDLATGETDVAIRLHEPEKTDMIARPLATFHAHIYASPDYLTRRGTPETVDDLAHHDLIAFATDNVPISKGMHWPSRLGEGRRFQPRLVVNNLYGVLGAVQAGMGIAILPDYLTRSMNNLVRLLPGTASTHYNSFYCYAPELRGSKRVALLYDFLLSQVRNEAASL